MQFLNCSMFDNRNLINPPSDHIPVFLKQQHSLISLKDSLSSLTYRINEIQSHLSRKINRSQFMSILDKKISFGHLKHCIDELQNKMKEDHRLQEERNNKMQSIAIHKINELSKKLKTVNISNRGNSSEMRGRTKAGKGQKQRVIETNELFIQSNQTMFSLIIDEIAKLQEKDSQFEKQLQSRNKKIVNLNNEVCKKLEKLQNEIEDKLRTKISGEQMESKYLGNSWSQLDRQSKPTVHKGSQMESSTFQSVRFQMISRNIQAIQRQLLGKMNIKDVLPIIKQNSNSITSNINQVRQYVQQSIQSTRKILASQTEINHELSSSHRVGWWHSLSQYNQIAVISKQIINLVPQIFQVTQQSYCNFITIFQQGLYLIKILPLVQTNSYLCDNSQDTVNNFDQFQVMIGTEVCTLGRQSLLRLEKNSQFRVILRDHVQIVICLQKL